MKKKTKHKYNQAAFSYENHRLPGMANDRLPKQTQTKKNASEKPAAEKNNNK